MPAIAGASAAAGADRIVNCSESAIFKGLIVLLTEDLLTNGGAHNQLHYFGLGLAFILTVGLDDVRLVIDAFDRVLEGWKRNKIVFFLIWKHQPNKKSIPFLILNFKSNLKRKNIQNSE